MASVESDPILVVSDLRQEFVVTRGLRRTRFAAVDGVSFSISSGESLAIVGESGSGKSTLARAILRLVEPTSGSVSYRGRDLLALNAAQMRAARRDLQMIFQDPYASLHPRRTVADIISEPWRVHPGILPRTEWDARVLELLHQVGLPPSYAAQFPGPLSGGERQRVAIARALALSPEVLVLDEPVSALDVSIQAQVIRVLMSLQQELGLAYVFISHDLSLVRLIADRVAVMSKGRFVEVGDVEDVYTAPQHPYTQALLGADPALMDSLDGDDPGDIAPELRERGTP
ncbi:MAG TPA: ATP-binding cassette domain-containing protein [Pseudolysinimonas sp.]|nr:ATP-binding cassette domain-containing protein [Pseudolysinimonas sp.]